MATLLSRASDAALSGDWKLSLALFDEAVAEDPTNSAAHEQRAQVLLELERPDEAVEAAAAAVKLQPDWAVAWLTLGRAQLNAAAFADAVAAFRHAMEFDRSLTDEVGEDMQTAQNLLLQRDEANLRMCNSIELKLQQWRGVEAEAEGCMTCLASGTPLAPREGTGTMIWECGIVLAKLLDLLASGRVPADSPLNAAFASRQAATSPPAGSAAEIGPSPAAAPSAPLAGLRILELGSGTGIGGLAAAALGAHVTLTDTEAVMPLLRANCAANATEVARAGGTAVARCCDWTQIGDATNRDATVPPPDDSWADCDVILAADVLYQRLQPMTEAPSTSAQLAAVAAMLECVVRSSSSRPCGARLVLVHKSRHASLDEAIPQALRARTGLVISQVPLSHHHPDYRSESVVCFVGVPETKRCAG